jgi:5-formyltetrahydrofolate cyclo-ligase
MYLEGRDNDGERLKMRHVVYEDGMGMTINTLGVHEPRDGKSVSLEELDLIIVPALGAGRNGHRIGYGKGHYDEFLHALKIPTIGLVFAPCLVDFVPAEDHDVPLSILVTDREILRPTSNVTSLVQQP